MKFVSVSVPVPLHRLFDYVVPEEYSNYNLVQGQRVIVPFGNRSLVAVVHRTSDKTDFDINKLKPVTSIIDETPIFSDELFKFVMWAADYYHCPPGEAMSAALPAVLRENKQIDDKLPEQFTLTDAGKLATGADFSRSEKQWRAISILKAHDYQTRKQFASENLSSTVLKTLVEKGYIETVKRMPEAVIPNAKALLNEEPLRLNLEQARAVGAFAAKADSFFPVLLEGVTGSGKTEVYLQMIEQVLAKGKQVLVMVPEIGLAPQTLQRFRRRFNCPVVEIHSGLNDTERFEVWLSALCHSASIIIGTRSSIFLPFKHLGLIVVDEEHDLSFKQQDTFRYHARDLAVFRASQLKIPIILGTATPSLETLNNALSKRYHHMELTERISGNAQVFTVVDIKGQPLESGLSVPMINRIRQHLNDGQQVMLFINRRGYSPALLCHECGWLTECQRCSSFYTYHKQSFRLVCHHCGSQKPPPKQCESCGSTNLVSVGQGTEQIEEFLSQTFDDVPVIRIDRDSTQRKGAFAEQLQRIHDESRCIIVGTQMLAKGHHFPGVTLVGIMDVDGALYSADFRAPEKLAQLLVQVAGRSGRGKKQGEVVLQTHFPDHPLLKELINNGYMAFSRQALNERLMAEFPPARQMVMIRAEANNGRFPMELLTEIKQTLQQYPGVELLGPLPASMEKLAGKYRFQLMIQSAKRSYIQAILRQLGDKLVNPATARRVRWSVDVDPMDMY